MTYIYLGVDTATLLESLLYALTHSPLAILVSAELKIPINSFLCQLGCLVSIAGIFFVFVYTIIVCLSYFSWKFMFEYRLSEHRIRSPSDRCKIKLSADVNKNLLLALTEFI